LNERPLISLLHPTRRVESSEAFPRGWRDAHDAFLAACDHPEQIEYVIAVHSSRFDEFTASDLLDSVDVHRWGGFHVYENKGRDCVVDQTNCAAKYSGGKLLSGVADDYFPPEHWDTLLLESLPNHSGRLGIVTGQVVYDLDGEYVILCSTGAGWERDKELCIGASITRKRYERYGFILNPDFESMFADNWYAQCIWSDHAAGLCKVIERLDIRFDHRHPIFGKGQMDETYAVQNRDEAYKQGYATFMKKLHRTQVISVCMPGENFRAEVFWAANDLLLSIAMQGPRFILQRSGCHTSNVYCTRIEIARFIDAAVPKPDYVLWIDDDNQLTPSQFEMLYQDLQEHPELDGVVGWCWCDNDGKPNPDGSSKPWMMSVGRQNPVTMDCKKLTVQDWQHAQESGEMLVTSADLAKDGHAFWSGFPVALFRSSVHRRLGWRAFKPIVRDDVAFEFTSEDTAFFWHAHQAGMQFAVDLRVKVPHGKFRAIEPEFLPESQRAAALWAQARVLSSAAD